MVFEVDVEQQAKDRSHRGIAYCPEAKRLLGAFGDSVREMVGLHEGQLRSILDDEPDLSRFDLLIHYAQQNKENAKYAYIGHLEEHGCGNSHDEAN